MRRTVLLLAAAACACTAPPPRPPAPRASVVREGELVVDLDQAMGETLDQLFRVEVEVAAVGTTGRAVLARRTGCALHVVGERLVTARRLVRPDEYEPALAAEVRARRERGEVVETRARFTDPVEPGQVFAWPAPAEPGPVRGLDLGVEQIEVPATGGGRRDVTELRLRGVRRSFSGFGFSRGDELAGGDRVLILGGAGARPVRAVAVVGSDLRVRLETPAPEGALLGAPVVRLERNHFFAFPVGVVTDERGGDLAIARVDLGIFTEEVERAPGLRGRVEGAGEALFAEVHAYAGSVHPDTWLGSCIVLDRDRAFELPRAPGGPTLLVVDGPDGVRLVGPIAVGPDEDAVLRLDAAALSLLARSPAVRRERARRTRDMAPEPETRGHAEPGAAPSWVTVEGQRAYRVRAAEGDLRLDPTPAWFRLGWGPPARIDDLPIDVDGSRVDLAARVVRPDELVLDVVLHAGPRGLQLQSEHRADNLVPFLFAFEADGVPVVLDEQSVGGLSGSRGTSELVAPGGTERWSLRVDPASLDRIAPRPFPERLSVVVSFCEVQHGPGFVYSRRAGPPPPALDVGPPVVPAALLRSERVHLVRGDDGWRPE